MGDVSLPDVSKAVADALTGELGTGRVVRGSVVQPPMIPFAAVPVPQIASEEGPTMGRYRRTLTYQIRAWGLVEGVDPEAAAHAAESLADRVHSSLEQARLNRESALYAIPGFRIATTLLLGGEQHLPVGAVQVNAQLQLSYERRTGLDGRSAP